MGKVLPIACIAFAERKRQALKLTLKFRYGTFSFATFGLWRLNSVR